MIFGFYEQKYREKVYLKLPNTTKYETPNIVQTHNFIEQSSYLTVTNL